MDFNDLLAKNDIRPDKVLVLRHRPTERALNRALPTLVSEHPEVFNAYQQTQNPRVEAAMAKASHVASFIGHAPGKAIFAGLYSQEGSQRITGAELDQTDCDAFAACSDLDPAYAVGLEEAAARGVEVLCYDCDINPTAVRIARKVPWIERAA